MFDLLKKTYNNIENIRGKKLVYTLFGVFVSFVFIGILIGYYRETRLNGNEAVPTEIISENVNEDVSYEGIVRYIGDGFYTDDGISYVLTDISGNEIILLKATDDKLTIVEGLSVEAVGRLGKTQDGQNEVLFVKELLFKNATD
ncbi:hypothetical protein C4561_04250 [candidate division WWE3 bacterium]|jgi:hypothetical protein|uniref:Uncharacterized protein n=1 Tax=candidate division WWE3 bacterium TaxID=2053526 RepID=A0A3A4ZCI1_UNCKA|nr:MAG: hypothetical protein C4561_04250 [candidate division WWE3 bacterium]